MAAGIADHVWKADFRLTGSVQRVYHLVATVSPGESFRSLSATPPGQIRERSGRRDTLEHTRESHMAREPRRPIPFTSSLAHHAADPFRLLVESVKDYAIFMLDPAGAVASWNSGAERILCYAPEEILEKSCTCFYVAEDVARGTPQRELQLALAEERYEVEGERVRKDGTTFWAIVTTTALHDYSQEQHIGFAVVVRDITERRQAEAARRASEEPFRLMIEGVKDYAIHMLDPAGRITTWNRINA